MVRRRWAFALLIASLGTAACAGDDPALPDASAVGEYYQTAGDLTVEMSGNVAELHVGQSADQLRRGGPLWAKVGPYIFLFTEGTQQLFADHPALAGVRVVTRDPGGGEVARALLARDELNAVTWRRALNISGRARTGGTDQVTLIEQLVGWGEEHTTFAYHPNYVPNR